jgi:crotonobetainyl-CoA:carnitine CoA-transferase CaiB-like acyl-CoA transferase
MFGETPDHRTLVRPPWRFDGVRPERNRRAPRIGADTRVVISELLGEAAYDRLRDQGIVPAADARAQ